jgi:hypothetical protein
MLHETRDRFHYVSSAFGLIGVPWMQGKPTYESDPIFRLGEAILTFLQTTEKA